MFDGIDLRGFSQKVVEQLAEFSGVPVWNGLTMNGTQLKCWLTSHRQENFGHLKDCTDVHGYGRVTWRTHYWLQVRFWR